MKYPLESWSFTVVLIIVYYNIILLWCATINSAVIMFHYLYLCIYSRYVCAFCIRTFSTVFFFIIYYKVYNNNNVINIDFYVSLWYRFNFCRAPYSSIITIIIIKYNKIHYSQKSISCRITIFLLLLLRYSKKKKK